MENWRIRLHWRQAMWLELWGDLFSSVAEMSGQQMTDSLYLWN